MRGVHSIKQTAKRILPLRVQQAIVVLFGKHGLPGMISAEETRFYEESAARYVGKEGAVVDLGCWLGSTSIALARGILSTPDGSSGGEKVLAFDIFTWEQWMPRDIPYCSYEPGESFLPEARRLTAIHGAGLVELIRSDLSAYEWRGGPIKIILVDAMKSEDLTRQIARTFYPRLTTGSLLIHQDFKHFYCSWIHIVQYRLRDFFLFYRSVPNSGTVAFEVRKAIPNHVVDQAVNFANMVDSEVEECFRHSLDLVGENERANVAAAHVMCYAHLGRKEQAHREIEKYRRLGLSEDGEFPLAINFVNAGR